MFFSFYMLYFIVGIARIIKTCFNGFAFTLWTKNIVKAQVYHIVNLKKTIPLSAQCNINNKKTHLTVCDKNDLDACYKI